MTNEVQFQEKMNIDEKVALELPRWGFLICTRGCSMLQTMAALTSRPGGKALIAFVCLRL